MTIPRASEGGTDLVEVKEYSAVIGSMSDGYVCNMRM